jgi:23S rRNA (cytosine1962-C5)-methyltransferase
VTLEASLTAALARRRMLLAELAAEGTDCVRLFHGAVEGRPGLAIDRYGSVLLAQSWGAPIEPDTRETIVRVVRDELGLDLAPAFVERGKDGARIGDDPVLRSASGHELGLTFDVRPFHGGQDPLLFLDLRALRRHVRGHASGKSVLNLFAYTCGLGVAASVGGAREVLNVDFAASALAIGRANAERNAVSSDTFHTIEDNAIPILRQLAGLPVKGRGNRRDFQRVAARTFDLVLLDPPRWAKTPFGAIDVERDYPSLLRPAIRCVVPGGVLAATNHVPAVTRDAFEQTLRRSAEKEARAITELAWLAPEADFPSPDGQPPLKIALVTLA